MKMLKKIGCITLLVMFITVTASAGKTLDELENDRKEIDGEIKQTEHQIEDLKNDIKNSQKNIVDLDHKIENYQKEIDQLEIKVAEKKAEINHSTLELEDAIEKEGQFYDAFKERIKIMYEYGDTEYVEVLLEAKGLSDFYNRLEYINELVEYDNNMLKMLEENRNKIIAIKEELERQELEIQHLSEETKLNRNAAENARVEKAQELEQLGKKEKQSAIELQEKEEEKKVLEAAIKRKKEENKLKYDGGKMGWPVVGRTRISSPFGWRTHPVFKHRSFHTGIDIPGPTGTKVVAAAKGKVIFAGWGNAYGHYILIDHGKSNGSSYVTMYGHNSKMLVKEGDIVNREQVIAKMGSTGWSTGPHLHFGVMIDDKWVNPTDILLKP